MQWTFSLSELPEVARKIITLPGTPKLFALFAPMGAGKTTLVHACCDALGVTTAVGSPTFSIINEYESPQGRIFHIDCYRLRDEAEAIDAGVEDCLFSGNWCFVEWPEKIPHLFPTAYIKIHMKAIDSDTRTILLETTAGQPML